MKTFDNALLALYKEGRISMEEALKNADSENNLRMKIKFLAADMENNSETDLGGLSLFEEVKEEEFPFGDDF